MKKLITVSLGAMLLNSNAWAGSVGYTRTQSESSTGNKVKVSFKVADDHRFSISASSSELKNSTATDQKANSQKLTYKYSLAKDLSFGAEYKKSDEYNSFEGKGLALKATWSPIKYEFDKNTSLGTSFQLKFDKQTKTYKNNSNDQLEVSTIYLGVDQELPWSITVGADFTKNNFKGKSTAVQRSLDELTIAPPSSTDINSYTQGLTSQSVGAYIEYTQDTWIVGMSVSQDDPHYSQSKNSTSYDLYLDYEFIKDFTLSLTAGQTKTEESQSEPTKTYSGSIQYSF